ncbi:ATP-binding protein [Carboxylicivirga caseinilyticus]|uniref:sensor histidine kinase n=1 Tax=Carboxylicivirga caseinilyticus TaxID=3417572 RepID=UPI003D34FA15|nr:PAS domain-containing protein [Marinilabiliaceae bacterium A049]
MDDKFCLYDYIPVSICIIDRQYQIVYVNNTFQNSFSIKTDHLIGKKLHHIIPVFKTDEYLDKLKTFFHDKAPVIFTSGINDDSLTELNLQESFNFNISLLKCDSSEYAVITIGRNIGLLDCLGEQKYLQNQSNNRLQVPNIEWSAQKDIDESLNLSNKASNKLFSIIAHDLKTPLHAMVNLSDLIIQNGCKPNEPYRNENLLLALNISAKQSLEMVSNLLSWARTQLNSITPRPKKICLCELFNDIKQYFEGSLRTKKLSLEVTLPRENCIVNVDFDMLKIIVQNLLSNAIKYSYTGEKIYMKVDEIGNAFKISIIDKGVGMSDEVKKLILSSNDIKSVLGTNNELGTGLGLSVCKEFLSYHNSSLTFESSKDNGTIVSFYLDASNKD